MKFSMFGGCIRSGSVNVPVRYAEAKRTPLRGMGGLSLANVGVGGEETTPMSAGGARGPTRRNGYCSAAFGGYRLSDADSGVTSLEIGYASGAVLMPPSVVVTNSM